MAIKTGITGPLPMGRSHRLAAPAAPAPSDGAAAPVPTDDQKKMVDALSRMLGVAKTDPDALRAAFEALMSAVFAPADPAAADAAARKRMSKSEIDRCLLMHVRPALYVQQREAIKHRSAKR